MRFMLLGVVAAVACSHAAPNAEPAAQAPAQAPAQPAPAAETQAQAPKRERPKFDLASIITAAGHEEPRGLDWGDKGKQPASTVGFKNVKVLGDVTGDRFMAAMQSMQANLGQKCGMCHAVEKRDFASEEKPEKERARVMIGMAQKINDTTFRGHPAVTCYTCHRGEAKPAAAPAWPEPAPWFPKVSVADSKKPAGEVFKNVKNLKDLPADQLGVVMSAFNQALGVKCTGCHVQNDWASDDKKEKEAAREMMTMNHMISTDFYPGKNPPPVTCWTCHRGSEHPQRKPQVAGNAPGEHHEGEPQNAPRPQGG